MVTVAAGRPARTWATNSSDFWMGWAKIFAPPRTATMSAMLISATWLYYCAIWRGTQTDKLSTLCSFGVWNHADLTVFHRRNLVCSDEAGRKRAVVILAGKVPRRSN